MRLLLFGIELLKFCLDLLPTLLELISGLLDVSLACNSSSVTYVPLYDTLGPNAVEFIINHAEVSIAFVQENKIASILSCLGRCSSNLKTIVSFGNVSAAQKKEAEEFGASCFSWEEFLQLGSLDWDLPLKKKTDICTIMYTSGTTGEPKGVIIKNEAFMSEVLSIDQIIMLTDRVINNLYSDYNLVSIYQHEETKRTIIRLEQGVHSFTQKAMASHGALAMLYGCHSNYYIKKPEGSLSPRRLDTYPNLIRFLLSGK
ncbi:hypothetical protein RYX36_022549 [Vicia faba]